MRMIFALTPGRSGTMYLQKVLDTLPDAVSLHEPEPDFARASYAAQADRTVARRFWLEEKLPRIKNFRANIYIETSHVFVIGFAEALLELGVGADVIVLRRPMRQVALSLWRRESVPGRKRSPFGFTFHPGLPSVCRFNGWRQASDYELCYWHCLETEARTRRLIPKFRKASNSVCEITLSELTTEAGFRRLLHELGLPDPDWGEYQKRRGRIVNANPPSNKAPSGNTSKMEARVRKAVGCRDRRIL